MENSLKGRSLLTLEDFTAAEICGMIDLAIELKQKKNEGIYEQRLAHKNIAMIFLKPSLRTRLSFCVAAADEGATIQNFSPEEIRFGKKESILDIARVFGRMFDGIAFRGFEHEMVQQLAEYTGIPVWNALCDLYHPTQALADFMTIKEVFQGYENIKMAYIGDGRNNVVRSQIIVAQKLGIDLRIVAPPELRPGDDFIATARSHQENKHSRLVVTSDIREGVKDCDIIYSDVWVSMGEESLINERIKQLRDYKVTSQIMEATGKPDAIFLHCLPALHDSSTEIAKKYPDILEVDDEVFEGEQSRVFDLAENRMHAIKAMMIATLT